MKRFFMMMTIASVGALLVGCTGLGDDDDDNGTYLLDSGTYTVSNYSVTKDECQYASAPPSTFQFDVPSSTVNPDTGDVYDAELAPPDGYLFERIGDNLAGFFQEEIDNNPTYDCVEQDTYNFDGVITGDNQVTFTFTSFWQTVDGQDSECAAANSISAFPCETIEVFDIALP